MTLSPLRLWSVSHRQEEPGDEEDSDRIVEVARAITWIAAAVAATARAVRAVVEVYTAIRQEPDDEQDDEQDDEPGADDVD